MVKGRKGISFYSRMIFIIIVCLICYFVFILVVVPGNLGVVYYHAAIIEVETRIVMVTFCSCLFVAI